MWAALGHGASLAYEPWPQADESLLVQSTYKLPVQVRERRWQAVSANVGSNGGLAGGLAGSRRSSAYSLHGLVCAPLNTLPLPIVHQFSRHALLPPLSPSQVNGKMRGTAEVPVDTEQEGAVAAAREITAVAKQLEGKEVKKVIFVPGKILNLIVPGK